MYNEDDEKKVMPIRFFLGLLILIIIFVLLLLWLLPMSNINGVSNRIFKTNIEEMKQAAIQHFDKTSLPQEEGETTKITLGEMIERKYLLKVTDKNGKECDTEKSYVLITKKGDDTYEMKTNLKCSTEEDFVITNLGSYSYCATEICEQQGIGDDLGTGTGNNGNNGNGNTATPTTKLSCGLEVTSGSLNEDGVYNSNVTVKFKNQMIKDTKSLVKRK